MKAYNLTLLAGIAVWLGSCSPSTLSSEEFISSFNQADRRLQSANCYMVKPEETFLFAPVRGNSSVPVGDIAYLEVLWESLGTETAPPPGRVVWSMTLTDQVIRVQAGMEEGNAVIAAKNDAGTILWSWHIWVTSADPAQMKQSYGSAGVLMDRNLGALSADPDQASCQGLLYQWGRKDPFLGAVRKSGRNSLLAQSSVAWPEPILAANGGSINFATQHPMTEIKSDPLNQDWLVSGTERIDETRWGKKKTIYDPCPYGWRVPDGGPDGVWASADFDQFVVDNHFTYLMAAVTASAVTVYYPLAGYRLDGTPHDFGSMGGYWSATVSDGQFPYYLYLNAGNKARPSSTGGAARMHSVRCQLDETVQ